MKPMRTYCRECLAKNKEGASSCSSCENEINAQLAEEEVRPFVQRLHKRSNVYRERISMGLSFLIVGLTLLIIGVIFYYLSFKIDRTNEDEVVFVLTTTCAEFWVAMIGMVGGSISTAFGFCCASVFAYKRRSIYHDMDEIRSTHCLSVSPTPLIFAVWWKKISYFCRQTIFRFKRKQTLKNR